MAAARNAKSTLPTTMMLKTSMAMVKRSATCKTPKVPNVMAYPITSSPSVTGLDNTHSKVPLDLSFTKVMRVKMVVKR